MFKRFVVFLPIIAAMILFVAPAKAATLPNICAAGKWISCGNNAYYCTAMKGDSCKVPTWVVTRTMENWSQKQGTSVPKGVAVKRVPSKYVYKYVTKKVCTKNAKTKKNICKYKKVRILVKKT